MRGQEHQMHSGGPAALRTLALVSSRPLVWLDSVKAAPALGSGARPGPHAAVGVETSLGPSLSLAASKRRMTRTRKTSPLRPLQAARDPSDQRPLALG